MFEKKRKKKIITANAHPLTTYVTPLSLVHQNAHAACLPRLHPLFFIIYLSYVIDFLIIIYTFILNVCLSLFCSSHLFPLCSLSLRVASLLHVFVLSNE